MNDSVKYSSNLFLVQTLTLALSVTMNGFVSPVHEVKKVVMCELTWLPWDHFISLHCNPPCPLSGVVPVHSLWEDSIGFLTESRWSYLPWRWDDFRGYIIWVVPIREEISNAFSYRLAVRQHLDLVAAGNHFGVMKETRQLFVLHSGSTSHLYKTEFQNKKYIVACSENDCLWSLQQCRHYNGEKGWTKTKNTINAVGIGRKVKPAQVFWTSTDFVRQVNFWIYLQRYFKPWHKVCKMAWVFP